MVSFLFSQPNKSLPFLKQKQKVKTEYENQNE
jgi:hypothetical protein